MPSMNHSFVVKIETMENITYSKLLVPFDFSDTALNAFNQAITIAKKSNATIYLLHVVEELVYRNVSDSRNYYDINLSQIDSLEKEIVEKAKVQLEILAEKARTENKLKIEVIITTGIVREQIINTVEKVNANLIVMGTHGTKGFVDFFVGSNTIRVISESKHPILTISNKAKSNGFKKILLPFRDEYHSREKVDYAFEMAQLFGAEIHILAIDTDETKESSEKLLLQAEQIKRFADIRGIKNTITTLSEGYAPDTILNHAKMIDADLLVIISTMDKVGIAEFFKGSFCEQIVKHASIPVLSIYPKFNAGDSQVYMPGYDWQP